MYRTVKLVPRYLITLLIFILAATVDCSIALAQGSEDVCAADPAEAILRFASAHEVSLQRLMENRAIGYEPAPPKLLKSFERRVEYYLSGVPHSALLAYARDGSNICAFLWKLDEQGMGEPGLVYVRENYSVSDLARLSEQLSDGLNVQSTWRKRAGRAAVPLDPPPTEISASKLPEAIRDLSELFFPKELRPRLAGVTHLSLLPIGGMSAIPVSLLEPYGDGRPTADLFSIVFLTSYRDIEQGSYLWSPGFLNSLIVGNPRPSVEESFTWPPLPGAEAEARYAHRVIKGKLLVQDLATKAAIQEGLADSDLIYFAGHGYSSPANALDESFLVLGDGRLSAREVQYMKLRNEPIVVLSACQTGEGHIVDGGIIGIARGFQLAGASNTVMSLWVVDDAVTADMMSVFIRKIGVKSPAEALRIAMLEIRKKYPDPRYWAAFNVFGNHGESESAGAAKFSFDLAMTGLNALLGPARARLRVGIEGGNRVNVGQRFRLEGHSEIDGQLIVLDVDANHQVSLIYPNRYLAPHDDGHIGAGAAVFNPADNYWGLVAGEPIGKGSLLTFVVPRGFEVERTVASSSVQGKRRRSVAEGTSFLLSFSDQIRNYLAAKTNAGQDASKELENWGFDVTEYEILP